MTLALQMGKLRREAEAFPNGQNCRSKGEFCPVQSNGGCLTHAGCGVVGTIDISGYMSLAKKKNPKITVLSIF